MNTRRNWVWALFAVTAIVNGLLLWHFHDRYFYPTDDGLYAHIAERLLNGAVLNRDVQDIHPGYIHFLHAGAFRLFGMDIVSLRYPLVLACFAFGCLTYALLQSRGAVLAAIGSVAVTALGVIQFFDPTPEWYCPLFLMMLACWMTWLPARHPVRMVGAGLLLGVLTLFRQLSGVWAAMGLFVVVLLERSDDDQKRGGWFARVLLLIMLAALVWYLIVSPGTKIGGVLLVALWPLAILMWMLVKLRVPDRAAASATAQLAAGVAVSLLPLVIYHLAHGSLRPWFGDTVLAGFGETQMSFFGSRGWLGLLPLAGLYQAVSSQDVVKIANGLYWVALPLISFANGVLILNHLHRERQTHDLILPVFASFYALVSIYFEGPLYLYYVVGLSLAAVLWFSATGSLAKRITWATIAAGVSVVAIFFHAGQSRLRTPTEILEGRRLDDVWNSGGQGLDRCSLRLVPVDRAYYGEVVKLIQRETSPDATMLVLPNDAELYFMARRLNPFRFYNSALGIQTPAELADVMDEMKTHPPRLVAFRPADKYNTAASGQIMDLVRSTYVHVDTLDGLEIYTLKAGG